MDFSDPQYYENRELSWLKFDSRVLGEAKRRDIPLLERVKFMSIVSSNLDEFFMVRVASLQDMENDNSSVRDIAGLTAKEQLSLIDTAARELVESQYNSFNRSILPGLEKEGITIADSYEKLSKQQQEYVDAYFDEFVFPVLTPMAVDSSRPFPLIRNRTLNIAVYVAKKKENTYATVQVPSGLPRLVPLSGNKKETNYILLERLIEAHIDSLFQGFKVLGVCPYRVMRNADFSLDEDEISDLLSELSKKLKSRQRGDVIRLEVESHASEKLLDFLTTGMEIENAHVFRINGPLDLTFLMGLYGIDRPDLKLEKPVISSHPLFTSKTSIFDIVKKNDVMLHHPYQSFDPVVNFIKEAAADDSVLAIKQTLYRVSGNSPIIAHLARAAEKGKQVTVLVELKARFDEENNIVWAKKLEQAGCHVIYGLVGLKTHSKIALVVRREEEGIVRYVHLGTGNYNDSTARLYTDCGLFTCNEAIGEDATALFNMLSGYSEPANWNHLLVAPIWLRNGFSKLIRREIKHANEGKTAYIKAKMNSLCDKEIIELLYEASAAGVKIDLIIRGICSLKPGIKGVSDNITVRSIIGYYLEHSRIFIFGNAGREEVYMGSADWMPRNLDKRVEVVFPVLDKKIKDQARHILEVEMADTEQAHILKEDGEYHRVDRRGRPKVDSQHVFTLEAKMNEGNKANPIKNRVFTPVSASER